MGASAAKLAAMVLLILWIVCHSPTPRVTLDETPRKRQAKKLTAGLAARCACGDGHAGVEGKSRQPLARRRATHLVKPSLQKYFTFPNFGFVAYSPHPGPAKGALRDRQEM